MPARAVFARVSAVPENPKFEVRGLQKSFHSGGWLQRGERIAKALQDIAFSVNEGESLGIVGESGSGKSTLARILAGLETADQGELNYRSKPLGDWLQPSQRKQYRQEVQFVFQDPSSSLNPRKTIRQSLESPLQFLTSMDRMARRERLDQVLQEAHIEADFLTRYPHEFSGGQAQRIAIARALIVNPKVLIMDEPVSALDVSIQSEILELLKDLHQKKGITFLFITHDLAVVYQLCPRILVLKDGKIVEDGSRQTILKTPKQDYTKELLSSIMSFKTTAP